MVNRDSLLIVVIGVFAFTIGLGPEFLGLNCRFGMFTQEMLRNGPTFFPTTYGMPYPDYPAASTFLSYLASIPFGRVTTFSAILPTAIVSALILVGIYRIGAMRSRQWGLFAVMMALFTKEFFSLSRSISTDQYTTLATVLCFYLIYSADIYARKKRLWFIPLLFVAGFAFRGPIGLVIPAAVVCTYYLYNKSFKKLFLTTVAAAILFLICFKGMLLAADYQGGADFVGQVWKKQMAGRMDDVDGHGLTYYWLNSFAKYALAYPIAVVVVIASFKKIFRRQNADYTLLACLLVWILVVITGMSIPATKKIRYILPLIPAVALVASYIFIEPKNGFLAGMKKIFLGFCAWFPAGAFIGILVFWFINEYKHFGNAYYAITLVLTLALAAVSWRLGKKLMEGFKRDLVHLAIGTATFICILVGIKTPLSCDRDATGPFVQKVINLQNTVPGDIAFYKINADNLAIKFMVNLDKPIKPMFTDSPQTILAAQKPLYVIALKKDFDALPTDVSRKFHIADRGTISGDDCVVFTTTN